MITVAILLNGYPLIARSAHRRTSRHNKDGKNAYLLDTGEIIYHTYEEGAIKLAIKMLKTIKERNIT
jgi:hypothetical protein